MAKRESKGRLHGGRRFLSGRKPGIHVDTSNSGRPPDQETDDEHEEIERASHFRVDGQIFIDDWNSEQRLRRDKAIVLLNELGLTPRIIYGNAHARPAKRSWPHRRSTLDFICDVVKDLPASRAPALAYASYYKPQTDWTLMSEKHAIMKFNVAVGRLILDGRVVRRYDDHGKAIYFTVDHPDIEKHAESLDKARVQRYKELRLRRIISEETE